MYRLTTPIHTFTFPEDPQQYAKILISYAQNGKIILEKKKTDLMYGSIESKEASVKLSQEETKLFMPNQQTGVQVRVLTTTGDALASAKFKVNVDDVFNKDVIE